MIDYKPKRINRPERHRHLSTRLITMFNWLIVCVFIGYVFSEWIAG